MADKKVVGGLKWVKSEIGATLRPVRNLVDAGGAGVSSSDLTASMQALDQVQGVLLALQLPTPARLVHEMIRLTERMADGAVPDVGGQASMEQAAQTMGQALNQLSNHLDRLDAGFDEPPLSLWSILNEVRGACQDSPLSHSELLTFAAVNADGDSQWMPEALDLLAEVVRQVRPQFHRHLVAWYRGDPDHQGLIRLGSLFHQLHGYLKEGLLADLFRLAEVFAAALREGHLPQDSQARSLMGHLDWILKPLAQKPPQWPEVDALTLIEQLLTTLSAGQVSSPLIAQMQAWYGAQTPGALLPREDSQTIGNEQALAQLATQALDEFAGLKTQFDRLALSEQTDRAAFGAFSADLRRLAATLGMAEAGTLPLRLRQLATNFDELASGERDEARLETYAMELLGIEAVLLAHAAHRPTQSGQIIAPDMDLSELTFATLRETGYELVRVKEAIANAHVEQGASSALAPVRDHLLSVSGALRILGEHPAADLSEAIGNLVQRRYVKTAQAPTAIEFEHLADAVAALELYIGHLQEAMPFGETLIERAGQSLAALAGGGDVPPRFIPEPTTPTAPAITEPVATPPETLAPSDSAEPAPDDESAATAPEPGFQLPDPDSSTEIESEFLDIFLEEAHEETASAQLQFARWESNPHDAAALASLRRSFHTLKGSGRLVGARQVGDFAQAIEHLLNRLIEGQCFPSEETLACIAEAVEQLPELIAAEAEGRVFDIDPMIARANRLREQADQVVPAPVPDSRQVPLPGAAETEAPPEALDHDSLFAADEELLRIFQTETHEHLTDLRAFLQRARSGDARVDEPVQRALHTLTGSARMAGIGSIATVTKALEQCIKPLLSADAPLDGDLLALFQRVIDGVAARVDELPTSGIGAATLAALAAELAHPQPAIEAIPVAPDFEPPPLAPEVAEEQADMHSEPLSLDDELVLAEESPGDALDTSDWQWTAESVEEPLELDIDHLVADADTLPETVESDQETATAPAAETVAETAAPEVMPEVVIETPSPVSVAPESPEDRAAHPQPIPEDIADDARPAFAGIQPPGPSKVMDPADSIPAPETELASLFLEDARDLLDNLDTQFRTWQLAPQDLSILDGINRLLHTLKGSARLTGLAPIGDLSHALESRLKALGDDRGVVNDTTLELAQRAMDMLSVQVDALEQGASIPLMTKLVEALAQSPLDTTPAGPEAEPDVALMRPAVSKPLTGLAPSEVSAGPAPAPEAGVPMTPQIRVRSDLLNRLVNHAGEISIYRGRLTQRNGQLGFGLGELDQTVVRLREQLRLLEIETQTQIRHRFEREAEVSAYDGEFDPLEFDRFSRLQQLSGSLAETVNDLVSVKEMLSGYQREFTDLLTQQARLADDLQDGLLRTRLVPFVQVVPRLHRLVRQTADSLGKSARLEVIGPEVELDRTILDRLVAPLEHLLRNAVDHGLEDSKTRIAHGKPATGRVTLSLHREGNDAVISLSDDGKGMDLDAIRRQAITRGLLSPDAKLPDEALLQFILEPGFTTSGKVTQISGRGVGLDVVASEIKAANGSIELESVAGQGARFTIRLPLTLAIIEAFLVAAGDNIYAVPHSTVEAAARIAREDLLAIYRGEEGKDFVSHGHHYKVVYLGGVLDPTLEPEVGERRWLPLLLTRFGEQRVALHVDSLIESQRILVKPLGPQLAGVRWLSGGTILPDGRVALILDALALLRSGAVRDYRPVAAAVEQQVSAPVCVMVVDDSLTVRRVTSRLLRRQNIEVLTAKDGVEALTLLDEHTPDLLLLDIEMPRMDGYELTRHIRRSDRLHDLPIIMITSRTGEKHREYAMQLGVDRYLGKPYQESELLAEINALLAERAR